MQGVGFGDINWENLAAYLFNLLAHQNPDADIKRLNELQEAVEHYGPMVRAVVEQFALCSFWQQHTGEPSRCSNFCCSYHMHLNTAHTFLKQSW